MIKLLIPFLLLGIVLSTSDFLVNLETEGGAKPWIEVERFHFGASEYTIMFHAEFASVTGTKRVIQFNGENTAPVEDDNLVIVEIIGANTIGLCFGRQENYKTFGLGFNLEASKLHSFAVTVSSVDSQNVNVNVFVDGVKRIETTTRGKVAQGFRTGALGAKVDGATISNFMNGLIDNVVVLNNVISTTEISVFHNYHQGWDINSERAVDVALWLHFDDSVQALTNTAVAVTNIVGANAEWVVAHIHEGVFLTHSFGNANWKTCSVTGDPHYYKFGGGHVSGGEQLIGHYIFQTCDTEDYEIRTHTRMCVWWANTVFRVVTLRYKDFIFRINQDENTPNGDTRSPWTPTHLGLVKGRFMKHVSENFWSALGTGTFTHEATGARYSGTSNGNMVIVVPDVATLDIRLGDNRYINIYLSMNLDRCVDRRGSCDGDLYNEGHVLFEELVPTALPDTDLTGENSPCDFVDTDILALMEKTCANYYPSVEALYQDCLYDACSSGDAEMVPSADMTPECQLARLTGIENDGCVVESCPNSCSGRGECVNGACVCDPEFSAWGGFDCGQKNEFMCHSTSYGVVDLNVQPVTLYTTRPNNLVASFHDYTVMSSLLVYPTEYNGKSYLQFVASSPASELAGAFTVCAALNSGSVPTGFGYVAVPLDSSVVTGGPVVMTELSSFASGELCVKVEFNAYSSGGFYFETTEQDFTISIKDAYNLQQVLVASENGRGGIDVSKIPQAHLTGFNYNIRNCDNANCHQHDENCADCYQEPGCGFCMETQRCTTGTTAGPARGICRNWRVSLDDDVSRVVTVKYNGDDLVDPDYEVFLSSIAAGSTVPVDVFVPTGRTNDNIDIQFMFSTAGSYALNAGAIKTNLLNALQSLQTQLNLGTGFYGNLKSVNTLTPSVVDLRTENSNALLFGRALSSPIGLSDGGVGGQFEALQSTIVDTTFRRYARRIVALTVYDKPEGDAGLAEARNAVLDNDVFTVFVIPSDVSSDVVDYYTDINNRLDGIPSIVVRIDRSGSNFASAFRTMFLISASFPHVVIRDIAGDAYEYNHVDLDTIADEADALSISGLLNTRMRARFTIQMKKGDESGSKVAKISVPGFGNSLIEDVPSTGVSVAADRSYTSLEDETDCVEVTLDGSTYKDLFAPLFEIMSLPTPGKGTLYEKDCSQPSCVGAPVTLGFYAKKVFCFTPEEHDHSVPAGAVYNSFTYRATDGCTSSSIATISISITPRFFAPQASDISLSIFETEQTAPLSIDITAFEADKNDLGESETVSYTFSSIDVEDFNTVLFGAIPTGYFHTEGSEIDTAAVYGPYVPVDWYTTQTIQYVPPSEDIFGRFVSYVTVTDNHSPTPDSNTYRIQVDVVPVNDAPTGVSVAAGFDATGVNQFMKEDTVYSIVITGEDIDNFGIGIDVLIESNQIPGSVVGPSGTILNESPEWYEDVCRADAASRSIVCTITVTSPAGWSSCDMGTITGMPDLATVQSTCFGPEFTPAVTLKYRVNDHNNLWGDSASDVAPKSEALSAEGVVNLHVLAVNDAPLDPPTVTLMLVEDNAAANVDITIKDEDSSSDMLDVYIRNVCADYFTLTQQSGDVITVSNPSDGTVIEDVLKRIEYAEQAHRFLAEPLANVHGGSRDNNWLLCQIQTYAWDGELPSQGDGVVNIHVRPTNDAPYDLATEFTKYEDYESIYSILDLTASDIDTPLADLTYTITQIPRYGFQGNQEGEGVTIHIILESGEISNEHLVEGEGCEFCLPYTVQLNSNNEAKVYVRNVANWYGTLSGDETLRYNVTDVDSFLLESDEGYKINSVPSTVDITIKPVNDKPIVTIQPPSGLEDEVQIIYLLGKDEKYGEDDTLTVTIEDIDVEYSSIWTGEGPVFFHYDEAWYNLYLADPTVSTDSLVELLVGEEVDDWPSYRVLFVPPQHQNIDASSTETPLFIKPSLKYRMVEIDSHAEPVLLTSSVSDYVYVTVISVNDVPVTWGGVWETLAEYEDFYGGFSGFPVSDDGETNYDNTRCVDNCYYLEDFGSEGSNVELEARNIYFGGRDAEGDDLRVVIRAIDCKEGANFTFITDDNTHPLKGRTDIKATELVGLELGKMIERGLYSGYALTNLLAWSPAFDDWNEVNPNENHPNYDITNIERDSYCTIDYAVIDEEGVASDSDGASPKTITLTVRQVNDQPQDSVLIDADTTSANLIGYEDRNLFIRIDAFDKENDDFDMAIVSCEEKGSFYYPSSTQKNFISADGSLTSTDVDQLFDMSAPVDCSNPSVTTFNSADADNKGWYILFVPVESDYALEYNSITVSYDDNVIVGQEVQTSTRNIKILPVNDAPVITHATGSGADGRTFAATLSEPAGLGIAFDDIDAEGRNDLGFRIAVTKIELQDPSATYSTSDLPYEYTFVSVLGVSNPLIKQWTDDVYLGYISWRSSAALASDFIRTTQITFNKQGTFEVEVVAVDNGRIGYCPDDVVFDGTKVYPDVEDPRNRIGREGEVLAEGRCNRVTEVVFSINVTPSSVVIGGITAGAGAGLLALLALGAVAFAKLNKPEDLNAWEALDNAQITNAHQSGIHEVAMTGGQSSLYQPKA